MSASYWERRYAGGGCSGAGSRGPLAALKARTINQLVRERGVRSVLDIGSGDGYVASLLDVPGYLGIDPSAAALQLARERCPGKRFQVTASPRPRELHLSLDVIFHLIDDDDFAKHLRLLFSAERLALVHATDVDNRTAEHVRHRRWTHLIPEGWKVLERRRHRIELPDFWILGRAARFSEFRLAKAA